MDAEGHCKTGESRSRRKINGVRGMMTHLKKRLCALIPLRWRRIRKARLIVNSRWVDLDAPTFERRGQK